MYISLRGHSMKVFKKAIFLISLLILTSLTLISCSTDKGNKEVVESEGLKFFKESFKDSEIKKFKTGDLNDDGIEDTVVVFTHKEDGKSHTEFTVILGQENGFKLLEHFKAPRDNQNIEIKDTDNKKPMEFVISGSKNGELGLGIYRVQGNKVVDLFGSENMDAC